MDARQGLGLQRASFTPHLGPHAFFSSAQRLQKFLVRHFTFVHQERQGAAINQVNSDINQHYRQSHKSKSEVTGRSEMAKRKRNNAHTAPVKKPTTTGIPSPPHDTNVLEPANVHSVISSEEIEVTVETLQTLTEHPALIKSKACKDLRTAVWDFRQACTTGLNSAGKYHFHEVKFRANR
jgi:hypothetical protein